VGEDLDDGALNRVSSPVREGVTVDESNYSFLSWVYMIQGRRYHEIDWRVNRRDEQDSVCVD
jgi:hypothetical protein